MSASGWASTLGGDNYWSGAAFVKNGTAWSFEGTTYRQCHYGPINDENGASSWYNLSDEWKSIFKGACYTILSREAGVVTREERVAPFESGVRLTLPPFSMRGLVWEEE